MPNMVAASQSGGSGFSMLLLLLPFLLIALMFFSQRKRAQATQRAQAALSVGDEVCTTSGMYGTLRRLDDATGEVEVAPGTVIRFDRRALLPANVDPVSGRVQDENRGDDAAGAKGDAR